MGQTSFPYAFTTVTEHAHGSPVSYLFSWGDGRFSEWSGYYPSGTPTTMYHAYDSPGTYLVKAVARNLAGIPSLWSPSHEIVIGTPTGFPDSVIATIDIGGDPHQICCHPNGQFLYVGQETVSEVVVVRTSDYAVVARVPVMAQPWDVACTPDGEYLYVTHHGYGLTVIRTSDNTVVDTLFIQGHDSDCGVFGPDGELFYVGSDEPTNTVTVIRTSDLAVVATIPVGNDPRDIVCLPGNDYVCTANYRSGDLSVIRIPDNSVVTTVPVGPNPGRLAALPGGDYLCVSSTAGNVSVLRTSDYTIVATVPAGSRPCGMAALPGGEYVYLSDKYGDQVVVVRTADNTVAATIPVGDAPWSVASLPDGTRLYTTDRYSETVTVIGY